MCVCLRVVLVMNIIYLYSYNVAFLFYNVNFSVYCFGSVAEIFIAATLFCNSDAKH